MNAKKKTYLVNIDKDIRENLRKFKKDHGVTLCEQVRRGLALYWEKENKTE